MIEQRFNLTVLKLALCMVFPGCALPALAAEPYPSLPPALSTSVTPNVMLFIDTSGSMLQDVNNQWMRTDQCDSNKNWGSCVDSNTRNYRTDIDDAGKSPNTKMNTAKRVAKSLVESNATLRFGLFSFEDNPSNVGGGERGESAILRAEIKDMSVAANQAAMLAAIAALNGRTATPLGEGLLEITRYFEGKTSLYGKLPKSADSYTSPIQYRCQKNFAIVITDGDATDDDDLPGSVSRGRAALPYTARDGNGAAVSKNFSVCTTSNTAAADDLSVNCPAGLEMADGSFTDAEPFSNFGDQVNRFRALRDVAKYARVADLRVGGLDDDAKSFDDPKFAKQNLTTYTVAFAMDKFLNKVLPAAAKVGGGKYYTAVDEPQLVSALNQAVDSIVGSISNAGGVATQSEATSAGNKIFQPIFNPNGWYGELRCLTLNADGTVGAACTPNAKAIIPTTNRNVYSSKVLGSGATLATTPFLFDDNNYVAGMTDAQKLLLGADSTAQKNTINFIRGVEGIKEGTTSFRSRKNAALGTTILLGDIVDGQPVVVSSPSGETPDSAYAKFKTDNVARNMVLVGANDGMMHAFNIADMNELMGYIPSAVYPRLKALTATDYGQSAGTPHAYHVNGSMRQQDIKVGTDWKTIVAGGLGQGGQGYYAVDVTNVAKLAAPATAIKWEWSDASDANMGYSFGAPLIYNVRASATTVVPAVIVSNGYESNWQDGTCVKMTVAVTIPPTNPCQKGSALYVLNADTGALLKKIDVPVPSAGLSSPAGVDVGQDGILDYVYAGDVNGKMWRFDLTADTPSGFKVITTPIFDAGAGHPIVMRPGLMPVNKASDAKSMGNIVLFGTGQLLMKEDRSDLTTQTLYGVLDQMEDSPTTVSVSALQRQSFETIPFTNADPLKRPGTYRKISIGDTAAKDFDLTADTNFDSSTPVPKPIKMGWFLDLPESSERLVTSPMVFDDKVLFGTGVPVAKEICLPGGKGWIIGLNPMTGSLTRKKNKGTGKDFSFIDISIDGKSTIADQLLFPGGDAYMSAYQKDGIPTELSYVSSASKLVGAGGKSTGRGDQGGSIALREANSMAVYTGNQKNNGTVTVGNSIERSASTGVGTVYGGTIGHDSLDKDQLLGAPITAVRIETTTWREIKQ
jgi:type IV pilus assembly protein PilY1